MPLYSIRDNNTGEIVEVNMSIADKQQYLRDNPHLEQVFTKFPALADPIRLGVTKPDRSFNDVLLKAKGAHKHSTINTR